MYTPALLVHFSDKTSMRNTDGNLCRLILNMVCLNCNLILVSLHLLAPFTQNLGSGTWNTLLSEIKKYEDPYQVTIFINGKQNIEVPPQEYKPVIANFILQKLPAFQKT